MEKPQYDGLVDDLEQSTSEIYKCPNCGANLDYDPANKSLTCSYCEYHLNLDGQHSNDEIDFNEGLAEEKGANDWGNKVKVFHCQNCGATNVVDAHDIANRCPFCGSGIVSDADELVGIRPHRVIPFKVSTEVSLENYRRWLKKKWFAPRKVKKNIPNPLINGVYLPSWTYDTNTMSSYEGRLGKRYTRTVGTGKNRHTVTEIRYFRVSGAKAVDFDDILICSGKKISQEQLDKISPFDTNGSFVYDDRYLAGFVAEHYEVGLKDGWDSAKQKATASIRSAILSGYNYDVVDYLNVSTVYSNVKYKYVLLPVWICSYKYKTKQYGFLVNGESGAINGKAPVSPLRVTFLVIIILIVIVVLFYFFSEGELKI